MWRVPNKPECTNSLTTMTFMTDLIPASLTFQLINQSTYQPIFAD